MYVYVCVCVYLFECVCIVLPMYTGKGLGSASGLDESTSLYNRISRCCMCADKCETQRVVAHERLGEVLRILRTILERYPALQSTELLVAAGSLINQVKGK